MLIFICSLYLNSAQLRHSDALFWLLPTQFQTDTEWLDILCLLRMFFLCLCKWSVCVHRSQQAVHVKLVLLVPGDDWCRASHPHLKSVTGLSITHTLVLLQRRTHHSLTGERKIFVNSSFGKIFSMEIFNFWKAFFCFKLSFFDLLKQCVLFFLPKERHLDTHILTMWFLGKIRENVESIPLELSRYMGKSEENLFLSSKTSLPHNLHNNILTPDKIPEFCLPPRLFKRSSLLEVETTPPYLHDQNQIPKSNTYTSYTHVKKKHVKTKHGDASVAWQATKKPLPFSAEGYGLAGIYESPNTRRKESLFHSNRPVYIFDRSISAAAPSQAKETKMGKRTLSGLLPLFSCKSVSETGSTENETPSSGDSSPLSSPYSSRSSLSILSAKGHLKGATSCPSLIDSREDRGRWKRAGLSLTTSCSNPASLEGNSLTVSPPVLLPLDVLQCQERLQREHVLPLQGRGKVRFSAEHTTFPANTSSSLSTVRVRVVSVEGLQDETDQQTLNCAVNLCLTPGKLQKQRSATIRNCRSPVFNEDFFFTELSRNDLLQLQLKLKVVEKTAGGSLRKGAVMGVIIKPLSQLLPLNKQVEE